MDLSTDLRHSSHFQIRQFRAYNIYMVLVMCIGSIGYGYSLSIIATTLAQPSFISYFRLDTRSNATQLIATMNGVYQAGGLIAVFTVSWFADRLGRRAAVAVSALITLVAGACLAGSVNVEMFIFFRFVSGAGAFMGAAAVPIWINEVVPPNVRGALVDIHSVGLVFGYMLATWVGYGFYNYQASNGAQWRAPLAFQCLPVTLLLLGLWWMAESPRWLIMNGQLDEAERILRKLHTPETAAVELVQIRRQMEIDKRLDSSYLSMFTKPTYRKRVILAMLTTCSIQFSGVLVINNYGPILYRGLGFGVREQFLYQGGWITLAFGCECLALCVVDLVSRPRLIACGIFGCMITLIIEATLVAIYASDEKSLSHSKSTALEAAVATIYVYVVIFELCLNGVQWAYVGELFPTHLRAKGTSFGVAGVCLMNLIWLQAAPTGFANIGWKFYLCFIIPSFVVAPVIWIWFPDTLGLPLEEIAALFGDKDELCNAERAAEDGLGMPHEENESSHIPSHVHEEMSEYCSGTIR
jgi:sugar porter (SP) family MFS transporter